MIAVLLAAGDPITHEWSYVAGAYGLVVAVLVAYAAWTIIRGRKLGRQLPPGDRRWS